MSAVGRLSPRQVRPAEQGAGAGGLDHPPPAGRRHRRHDLGLVRADRARRRRPSGRGRRRPTARRSGWPRSRRGASILASVFEDLDPRAEEKEGRPLRAILGDRLDRAAADLEGDAVGDPLVVARLQDRLGRTYRALGHAAKAKALFTKALAIRRAHLGADHADTLAVMSQQALALKDAGEVNEAIALHEQVRDAQARTLGADHPDTARHPCTTWPWRTGGREVGRGLHPAGTGPRRPVAETRARR